MAEPIQVSDEVISRIERLLQNEEDCAIVLDFLLNDSSRTAYNFLVFRDWPDEIFRQILNLYINPIIPNLQLLPLESDARIGQFQRPEYFTFLTAKSYSETVWLMNVFIFGGSRLLNVSTSDLVTCVPIIQQWTGGEVKKLIAPFLPLFANALQKLSVTELQALNLLAFFAYFEFYINSNRKKENEISKDRFTVLVLNGFVDLFAGFGGQYLGEKLGNTIKPGVLTLISGAIVGVASAALALALCDKVIQKTGLSLPVDEKLEDAFRFFRLPFSATNNEINLKVTEKRNQLYQNLATEDLRKLYNHFDCIQKHQEAIC